MIQTLIDALSSLKPSQREELAFIAFDGHNNERIFSVSDAKKFHRWTEDPLRSGLPVEVCPVFLSIADFVYYQRKPLPDRIANSVSCNGLVSNCLKVKIPAHGAEEAARKLVQTYECSIGILDEHNILYGVFLYDSPLPDKDWNEIQTTLNLHSDRLGKVRKPWDKTGRLIVPETSKRNSFEFGRNTLVLQGKGALSATDVLDRLQCLDKDAAEESVSEEVMAATSETES